MSGRMSGSFVGVGFEDCGTRSTSHPYESRVTCHRTQRVAELAARVDPDLGENLAQVPLDGSRAEKENGADLRVRKAVAGEPGNLLLLGGEIVARLGAPLPHLLARGDQLAPSTLGERIHSDRCEHVVSGTKLLAGSDTAARSAKPFAVEEMRSRELGAQPRPAEAVERFAVELF